ncbi:pyruvate, phosphate dikinase [Candidatus Chrysopegis kryptomonas]|uniref:Pyruvate, phosphate dikinase n=1 Tax=Candidatus Chryseopegocella kryptomonas TaxID=1633643 RepID=A0A0P1NXU1_9BACT|nr:pyruvate, phosphate dikinase [Candidatus Chrysopegis kryptomonas]CUT03559.1 pyruvate phosphate dikinase [Candidatus Chrysopegis kryptomonas]
MAKKYVYFFGGGKAEGTAEMKKLLGGKGANLAEMTNIGLPVPPGFTITTEVCSYYYKHNQTYPKGLEEQVKKALAKVEKLVGRKFGDPKNPLLVSVRSGAPVSMPGMMDTILNLGLNDETVKGLIEQTQNERFAWDAYRRFVQMYGDVVLGLKPESKEERDPFEVLIEEKKKARGVEQDIELTAEDLKELVYEFKELIKKKKGVDFPEDPWEQLWGAIGAVFRSWMNPRAVAYRKIYNIPDDMGTAVNVQTMVFGNMGNDSGTGVAFTRNPATGENEFYGEFLMNAQGEDVVAGIRTPLPISKLKEVMPHVYEQLLEVRKILESRLKDMQDIEFTIERGKLYMLQTRAGKRTGFAAVRIAVDMVEEGLITKEEALLRIEPDALNHLLRPIFDAVEKEKAIKDGRLLAKGLPAGPGAATGRVVFHSEDAEEWARRGEKVILARIETSPEDIKGMYSAEGILTSRGGMTSHAALVARQMGKVCVVGCGALDIDYVKKEMRVNGQVIKEGDYISIDGSTGEVILGKITTKPSEVLQVLVEKTLDPEKAPVYKQFEKLMKWADEVRKLRIRTNADLPNQAQVAVAFGAEGIGLTRTEHMFFEGDRIISMRKMILADTKEEREAALNELLPLQRQDFYGLFKVMGDRPVTIRTLDPPLHEFLPHTDEEIKEFSEKTGIPEEKIRRRLAELKEFNPMLGFRGCRLGIVYPEITAMQTRAIIEAACEVAKEGIKVKPEIMIPLVGHVNELKNQEKIVREVAEKVMQEKGIRVEYSVGTMIEVPRAAITADEIATVAEFFSFGTNDLTQMGMGLSRDDYEKFIYKYLDLGIYDKDPFQTIDVKGVGELMRIGVEKGRSVRPNLKVGICGEHGGDPATIEFCHKIGLDYVSCSPYRVPIARLAAARAALLYNGVKKKLEKTDRKPSKKVRQKTKAKSKVKRTK